MARTDIEWTASEDGIKGYSWNPITGCTKISDGCKNCYAADIAKRFWGDRKFGDVQFHPEHLERPLKWKKPRRIFVCSMGDLFHADAHFWNVDEVFEIISECPQHTFIILTKRPENINKTAEFPDNVHLGVSVENQITATNRIPILLSIPAAVHFVSYEPALGSINFDWIVMPDGDFLGSFFNHGTGTGINWLIIGCESGPNRRPMPLEWARSAVQQCQDAGVPVFVKQLDIGGKVEKDINKFPKDLQIRDYPL